jgi:methyl-accepting chemotaxis protein
MEHLTIHDNNISQWRQQLLRSTLPWICGLSLLAVASQWSQLFVNNRMSWLSWCAIVVVVMLIVVTVWRKAPYMLQACVLLLAFFVMATVGLYTSALAFNTILFFVANGASVAIFFGWRASILALAACVVDILVFGWAYTTHALPLPVQEFTARSGLFSTWIGAAVIMLMVSCLIIFSQNSLLSRMLKTLDLSHQSQVEIEQKAAAERDRRHRLQAAVEQYVDYMAAVGQGNLSAELEVRQVAGEDELLARLGQQLNDSTASLRAMIHQVGEAANSLTIASTEILAATTQQAAGAAEQSAAISQTTTTVEEVKAITEASAARAQEVASASQRTVTVARSGAQAVQSTILSMNQIRERVESIAENILALSEQTQQIGEIIETVGEIAAQSNMLALNASIEASRAGEQGKGFAVVAAEVRSLAEQSRQATGRVKDIITQIQKATNATVMATEEGSKGVAGGVTQASRAQAAIDQLAGVIDESAQTATQVLAGSQQQRTGIEQIAVAMQHINQATSQSLISTHQSGQSAQNLNELAQRLNQLIGQYQV